MNRETVNPLWWIPRGYIAVRVDGRGSGKSPTRSDCRKQGILMMQLNEQPSNFGFWPYAGCGHNLYLT